MRLLRRGERPARGWKRGMGPPRRVMQGLVCGVSEEGFQSLLEDVAAAGVHHEVVATVAP